MKVRWLAAFAVVWLLGAAPAWADTSTDSDLRVSTDHGDIVKGYATVNLHLYNYGPAGTDSGVVTYEYTAPPGTEIYDPHGAFTGSDCHWIVDGTHVKCTGGGQLWSNYNGYADYGGTIQFTIVSTVTGPGLYEVYCTPDSTCHDPDMSNNSAQIIINGAATPKPTPKPTPKATPKATPKSTPTAKPRSTPRSTVRSTPKPTTTATPKATLTPTETATPSPATIVDPAPTSSSVPPTFKATAQDESGSSGPWLVVGLISLAGLAAASALWWKARRRPA